MSFSTYSIFARFTFKTPGGVPFLPSKQNKALIRAEYRAWCAARACGASHGAALASVTPFHPPTASSSPPSADPRADPSADRAEAPRTRTPQDRADRADSADGADQDRADRMTAGGGRGGAAPSPAACAAGRGHGGARVRAALPQRAGAASDAGGSRKGVRVRGRAGPPRARGGRRADQTPLCAAVSGDGEGRSVRRAALAVRPVGLEDRRNGREAVLGMGCGHGLDMDLEDLEDEKEVEAILVGDDPRGEPLGVGSGLEGRTEAEMQVALTLATFASCSSPLDKAARPQGSQRLDSPRVAYALWHTIQVSVEQAAANLVQEWRDVTFQA